MMLTAAVKCLFETGDYQRSAQGEMQAAPVAPSAPANLEREMPEAAVDGGIAGIAERNRKLLFNIV